MTTEILRILFFLNMFERGKCEEIFYLFKPLYMIKTVKGDKY